MEEIEQQERDYDSHHYAGADDDGCAHVAHEESRDHKHEYESQYEILHEIGYGIVEQLGLVAALREFYVGIELREVFGGLRQRFLHVVHVLLALLYDGQSHGTFAAEVGVAVLAVGCDFHTAQIAQLLHAAILADVDVLYVDHGAQLVGYVYVVFIVAVAHGHRPWLDIVGGQRFFEIVDSHSGKLHLRFVGHYPQILSRYAGDVGHCYLRQLLYASAHDIVGQFAHLQEAGFVSGAVGPVAAQSHIEIQHRYVGGRRFNGLWPPCVTRQCVHSGVDLFVDFDKGEVGVDAVVKFELYDRQTVAREALYLVEAAHLQQLSAYSGGHVVLKLARTGVVALYLHCDMGYGYSGQKTHRE